MLTSQWVLPGASRSLVTTGKGRLLEEVGRQAGEPQSHWFKGRGGGCGRVPLLDKMVKKESTTFEIK